MLLRNVSELLFFLRFLLYKRCSDGVGLFSFAGFILVLFMYVCTLTLL